MAVIKKQNGKYGVYNGVGLQAEGSFTANSQGLNPKELLEASLAMCITIVLQRMFERDGIEVADDAFSVEALAVKAGDSPSRFEKCILKISLPDSLPADYKNKLILSAERACTIGNTLQRGVSIVTE
ncbi:OsmC family protein [Bacillaceae bacterium Marseille-Q3522]|nr:OsmC family protein [Bacillaceae bacterium Marseille-Q3522]